MSCCTARGGKPRSRGQGTTHPSNEYLLVFGMSMMSMKPLFPVKGKGGGYRVARRWAEQQTSLAVGIGGTSLLGRETR